jgi:hypothetical protein
VLGAIWLVEGIVGSFYGLSKLDSQLDFPELGWPGRLAILLSVLIGFGLFRLLPFLALFRGVSTFFDRKRRQIKILTICSASLAVAVIGLFGIITRYSLYGETWPSATLGELKVHKLSVVGEDGEPRIRMETKDGEPLLAVMNGEDGPNMFIADTDGKLNMMFEHGKEIKSLLNSDGLILQNGNSKMLILHVGADMPIFQMKDAEAEKNIFLSSGILQLGDASKQMVRLTSLEPSLYVRDENGYSTTIGRTTIQHGGDGSSTTTAGSTIVGASKTSASTWQLIKQNTTK